LYVGKDYSIYYDPFGLPMPIEVKEMIPSSKIYWNDVKHQMMNSILCGYYCILFIEYLSKGKDKIQRFEDFIHEVFTKNELDNNKKVRSLFHLQ